jgi:hypothetical protein
VADSSLAATCGPCKGRQASTSVRAADNRKALGCDLGVPKRSSDRPNDEDPNPINLPRRLRGGATGHREGPKGQTGYDRAAFHY